MREQYHDEEVEDVPSGKPNGCTESGEVVVAETSTEATDGEGRTEESSLSSIKAFTESEGVEQRANVSLREILGGDILTTEWLRRQMGLIMLCMFFAIVYITNRYSSEQEMIEIEKLKTELTKIRYHALTRSSELTVKTRQSLVEKVLGATADSVLQTPTEPPFLIEIEKETDYEF